MIRVFIFYGLALVACGYAWRRGGAPERWVATILLTGTAATWAIVAHRGYFTAFYRGLEFGMVTVDTVMLGALVTVALFADRFWPLWLSAMQAFGVIGHLAKAIAPDILPDVYLSTQAISAYPGLILLILATYWHRQRIAEEGRDPSWSPCSLASIRHWRRPAQMG